MAGFVGRRRELESLARELDRVRAGIGGEEPGRCLFIRGRRRVGKSRLLEVFIQRAEVPSVFFAASRQATGEVQLFAEEVLRSTLPDRDRFAGVTFDNWDAALRQLGAILPSDTASVVVIDEFPYLIEDDKTIEATLQKAWDRLLKKKPVLLALVGSDLHMMEMLDSYDRPLHLRGTAMRIDPLSPVEGAQIVGADDAAAAIDAHLVTGGLPLVCDEWPSGLGLWEYLEAALAEPTSALIVSGERAVNAEFPPDALARTVLTQIGAGEMTFTNIARAAGGLQNASASRALEQLMAKSVVTKITPLSTKPSSESRYFVEDPYLRFWLRFIEPNMQQIERGRGDLVLEKIRESWRDWRGRAVEPLVRESLRRLIPLDIDPAAKEIGGYWTRSNHPEVDIVGADRGPIAKSIKFLGLIKWYEDRTVTDRDLAELRKVIDDIPGAKEKTPLMIVSRTEVEADGADAVFRPEDLLGAW